MMKRLTTQKAILLPIIAAASLCVSTLALAGNNNADNTGSSISALSTAIKDLGNKMVALGFAGMTAYDQAMYQYDQNLLTTLEANTAANTINQNKSNGSAETNTYIQKTFQNIPNAMLSTRENAINAKKIEQEIRNQNLLVNNLTLGVPGSDTLYINNPTTLVASYGNTNFNIEKYYQSDKKYTIGPPPINDNSYFNVSSILSPMAYTKDQLTASKAYLAYLTKSYQSPASILKISDLKSYLNSLKTARRSQALYNFIASPKYQKYQLAVRSNMAVKSVAVNNLEYLMAERTPSKKPIKGIYNRQGKPIAKPSPLQVQAYQANHRIDNPAWIKSLQSQSSATLQREIAVELAQMIQQNHQAHLDRERMLTTLSAMELQSAQASQMSLTTIAQDVNSEIKGLRNNSKTQKMSKSKPQKMKSAKNAAQRAKQQR